MKPSISTEVNDILKELSGYQDPTPIQFCMDSNCHYSLVLTGKLDYVWEHFPGIHNLMYMYILSNNLNFQRLGLRGDASGPTRSAQMGQSGAEARDCGLRHLGVLVTALIKLQMSLIIVLVAPHPPPPPRAPRPPLAPLLRPTPPSRAPLPPPARYPHAARR
ncbi:unnamed protein product [Euphydryas editha]|uniref:Uncharacterized protein n=1 Tax=Euphydryas editha TaxID=104508 RepID=A0AAU9TH47_EUPED|nr:unnamed protein product [Euphydryas editha]